MAVDDQPIAVGEVVTNENDESLASEPTTGRRLVDNSSESEDDASSERFNCTQCGRSYANERTLYTHIQDKHSGVKPRSVYRNAGCTRDFVNNSTRNHHERGSCKFKAALN